MDAGVIDHVLGDLARALQKRAAHQVAFARVQLVVQPVVAPGQSRRDAEGSLVVVGPGRGAADIPCGDRQKPRLRPRGERLIVEEASGDRQVADRIQRFLAFNIDAPPDLREALVVRIGQGFRRDVAIDPRRDGSLIEGLEPAMVRLMPESLRESCRPVGAEPQARMPEIGARPSVRGGRKRRDRQPVGHGEGAAAAPVAGDDFPVRVPDGLAPPIASRREGVMRGEEVAPDAGIDRCRRVAVVLAG